MAEPIQKIEAWPLSVAIWLNEHVDQENPGKVRRFYNATLQRTFRDGDGNYRHTDSIGKDDLLLGAKLLDQAHSAILRLEAADFAKQQQARTP